MVSLSKKNDRPTFNPLRDNFSWSWKFKRGATLCDSWWFSNRSKHRCNVSQSYTIKFWTFLQGLFLVGSLCMGWQGAYVGIEQSWTQTTNSIQQSSQIVFIWSYNPPNPKERFDPAQNKNICLCMGWQGELSTFNNVWSSKVVSGSKQTQLSMSPMKGVTWRSLQ